MEEAIEVHDDMQSALPEVRTVREVYQAFLHKATCQGYPRAKDETPQEFYQRLHAQEPLLEPELAALTEVYALVRYGGSIPRVDDVVHVRELWSELERKWTVGPASL